MGKGQTGMKHDMVVFAEDWGRHPSATQHLVKRLAHERSVLWVNSIGLRRPRLNRGDMRRLMEKGRSIARNRLTQPGPEHRAPAPDKMHILSPLAIPWPGNAAAALFNKKVLSAQILKAMARIKISKPLLWCSLPTAVLACGTLNERSVIYYCGDDFSAWQGVDHAPVMEAEKRLVARADLILVASAHLEARFPSEKTLLIEHGVDHELFSTPAACPDDMRFNGPIAGFFGTIGDSIDVERLAAAARALDHWNFVMIGPLQTDCRTLQACPNVHFLGERSHASLAAYVQNWDVSLLPFRQRSDMQSSNPLKLREYLAAGTPIAATRFNALKRYEPLVRVAENEDGLAQAIERARHDHQYNPLRRDIVARESWQARADTIESVIATL